MIKLNSFISRTILKAIFLDSNCFSSWMRKYISPKELYFIKKKGLHKLSIYEFRNFIIRILDSKEINVDHKLIEFLIRYNTKLGLILNLIRSGFLGNFKVDFKARNELFIQILSHRIYCTNKISLGKLTSLNIGNKKNNSFTIFAPVCPDYSYVMTDEGRYRYTFESIGRGIGLVAKKAISNIQLIKEISSDLIVNGFDLNFQILIGDFEATPNNLNALNETKTEFLMKVSESCKAIELKTGIKTIFFTDLCNGLDVWNNSFKNLKYKYKLNEFQDLLTIFPDIKHEKNLISRLPLYKKWFGNNADFKTIFLNQAIEYMLMGELVAGDFFSNPILLASDHKVMKDYYYAISNVNVISSSADY